MICEEWRRIDGYSYEVSNYGRVRSIPRKVRNNKGFVNTNITGISQSHLCNILNGKCRRS